MNTQLIGILIIGPLFVYRVASRLRRFRNLRRLNARLRGEKKRPGYEFHDDSKSDLFSETTRDHFATDNVMLNPRTGITMEVGAAYDAGGNSIMPDPNS